MRMLGSELTLSKMVDLAEALYSPQEPEIVSLSGLNPSFVFAAIGYGTASPNKER